MSSIAQILLRGDTAAAWTAANPTLAFREVGLETDTRRLKVGDGTTPWSALAYYNEPPAASAAVRGQASRTTDGNIAGTTTSTYRTTGLAATFDSATASGMSLGVIDTFGLKNTSGATKLMRFYGSIDAVSGNNHILGIKLAKNGTAIDTTECRAFTGSSNSEAKLVTSWIISMAANDEVSLFIANHTDSDAITLKRGRILASEIR